MDLNPKVACSIVQGLAEAWKCPQFEDFTVTIGNVEFKCHRFILTASSEFFQGLFRSGMKETEQKCVTLKDISSQTFKLVLDAIYTGHAVLTNDNAIDIWRAAHQLQIHFLVSECESFITENVSLDNYLEYLYTSKTFNSNVVLTAVWSFILKNCDAFFKTSCFLELPIADVATLIKSQDLATKSEDDVMEAILKWAEFQDNLPHFSGVISDCIANADMIEQNKENEGESDGEPSRKKSRKCQDNSTLIGSLDNNLTTDSSNDRRNQGDVTSEEFRQDNFTMLLSHTRTFLASQGYLEFLFNHPLVRKNKEARNIVNDALMYQLQKGNGHWPSRVNADFIHCMVGACQCGDSIHFHAYTLTSKTYFKLPSLLHGKEVKLAAVDNKMFSLFTRPNDSTGNRQNNAVNRSRRLYLSQFLTDSWSKVKLYLNVRSADFNVAVVDSFLYIFSAVDLRVWKLDPATGKHTKVSDLPVQNAIYYVMPYDQRILVFYTSTDVGVDETVVQCYDTSENTWNQLNKIEGSSYGMTSFKDDHFTYLLQSNGNLWKVVQSQSNFIDFELVVKLWNCIWPVNGAFVYLGDLYIGVKSRNQRIDPQLMRSLPGVFTEIIYNDIRSFGNSVVTPFILSKNDCNNILQPLNSEWRIIKQL